jgi:hypothetical protein
MAWSKRDGLNVLSATNNFIDHTSYNQNIKARLAMGNILAIQLGGEGLYRIVGSSAIELTNGISVPPVCIIIIDDDEQCWYFSTDEDTSITFSPSPLSTDNGKLYACINVIDPEPDGGPAAIGGNADVSFVAYDQAVSQPDYSVLIGEGVIVNDEFTTFSEQNLEVVPPILSSLLWKLTTDGSTIQEIEEDEVLEITGDNTGIQTAISTDLSNPNQNNVQINMILRNSSGLEVVQNQLGVKAKTGSTIIVDSDGLSRDTSEDAGTYSFNVVGDSGDIVPIEKNDSLSISGYKAISTQTKTKGIIASLNLLASGGIDVDELDELYVKAKSGGKISTSSSGIARELAIWNMSGNTGSSDEFTEGETIYIQGSNSIYTFAANDNKLNINLKLKDTTNNGHESGLKVVGGKLYVSVDPKGNVVSGENGLYVENLSIGATYGYPVTGTYVIDDLYVDKSGATWVCTYAGIGEDARWEQLTVGKSYEETGNPNLPLASEFDTGYRPHMYRIRAFDMEGEYEDESGFGRVWVWYNYGRGSDYEKGFWISQEMFEMNWVPIDDWQTGDKDDLFDIEPYNNYREYRLYLKNMYDGFMVERTNICILKNSGAAYTLKANFYHQDIDKKYYSKTFSIEDDDKYKTLENQGRAFKHYSTRPTLLSILATSTDISGYDQYIGIKSTVRYIIDQDSNLLDS